MKTPSSSIHGNVLILSLHGLLSFVREYDYGDQCLLTKCKGGIFFPGNYNYHAMFLKR